VSPGRPAAAQATLGELCRARGGVRSFRPVVVTLRSGDGRPWAVRVCSLLTTLALPFGHELGPDGRDGPFRLLPAHALVLEVSEPSSPIAPAPGVSVDPVLDGAYAPDLALSRAHLIARRLATINAPRAKKKRTRRRLR
jgi:hypothetical protein